MADLTARIAGAPISWGICEVPGWGTWLPAARVLREMAGVGLTATEDGAAGFLPADPAALRTALDEHGLRLVGGFVPVVLHDEARADDTLAGARRVAERFAAAGADVFVSAVVVDEAWSPRRPLDDTEWKHLVAMLGRLDDVAGSCGLRHVLHPHVGTLVETAADVERVLDSSDVSWCLDTGHLALGGVDPLDFARRAGERVGHVHLKDLDLSVAEGLRSGRLSLRDATEQGLFRPLGRGGLAIDAVVRHLEDAGYSAWYVIEQDVSLHGLPEEDRGPVEDVRHSVEFLQELFRQKGDRSR